MRKKIYLFILCIIFIGFHANAQNYWLAEFLTDHEGIETNKEIISGATEAHPEDPGGGFFLTGFYCCSHDPFLIHIDRFGNKLWRKELDDFEQYERAAFKCAHPMQDHNILVGGNLYLRKINSQNGEEIWRWQGLPAIHYMQKYSENEELYVMIDGYYSGSYTINASDSDVEILNSIEFDIGWENYCVKLTTDGKFIFSGQWTHDEINYLTLCRTDTNLEFDNDFGTHG